MTFGISYRVTVETEEPDSSSIDRPCKSAMRSISVGIGNTVIDQYPKEKEDVYTNEKVFLLTSTENITIPDFTGWTRKEIISYWTISKLPITISGTGVAYKQSIAAYSTLDGSEELIIYLKDIQTPEPQEEENVEVQE